MEKISWLEIIIYLFFQTQDELRQIRLPHGTAYLFYDHGIAFGRLHSKSASWYRISDSRFADAKLFAAQRPTHIISYEYEPDSHIKLPEHFRHFAYDGKTHSLFFPVVRNTQEYEFGELTKKRTVYRYQDGRFVRQGQK